MKIYYGEKLPFKYYLPFSVLPSKWDNKKQMMKKVRFNTDAANINNELSKLSNVVRSYSIDCNINNVRITKSKLSALMKEYFKKSQRKKKQSGKITFEKFIDLFIEQQSSKVSKDRVKRYKVFKNHFLKFQKDQSTTYNFHQIDFSFYSDFIDYFFEQIESTPNTAGVHIAILKKIMKEAKKQKLHDNTDYEGFSKPSNKVNRFYLNDFEILQIWNTQYEQPYLQKAKDIFVFACLVGLRYSDFSQIKPHHIVITQNGYKLSKITKKTEEPVEIPLKPIGIEILKKYNFKLPSISNQKLNNYVKELGMIAGIDNEVTKLSYKGNQVEELVLKKYDVISSHTARRSFCTNAFLAGVPIPLIMILSGHTTEKAFMKYICITKEQASKKLAAHPWFNL